jgi:hypothetical protein
MLDVAVHNYLYMCYGRGHSLRLPSPLQQIKKVAIHKNLEQTASRFLVNWQKDKHDVYQARAGTEQWDSREQSNG